jgi:transcriptional regulator with XRE-family HTH domain
MKRKTPKPSGTTGEVRRAAAKLEPTTITDTMYRQDVAPFAEGFDVLATELAQALPQWMDHITHQSAGERAGMLLRTMRNAAGLTQSQLGAKAQMRQSDISDLENSSSSQGPTFEVVARIAEACGFDLTFRSRTARSAARARPGLPQPGTRVVRTFVMDDDGSVREFEGMSPSLEGGRAVIVDDAAGAAYTVSVDPPWATVAVEEAEDELAAAVQLQIAAG